MLNFFKRHKIKHIPIDLMQDAECEEILRGESNHPLIRAIKTMAVKQMSLHESNSVEMAQTKDYTHAELANELGKVNAIAVFLEELNELVSNKKAKSV